MADVAGLSADTRWWDAPPSRARVHSAFDHAVNLATGAGLLTVASRSLDDAPRTLRIDRDRFPTDASADWPGQDVQCAGGRLFLPTLTVSLTSITPWRPELPDLARAVLPDSIALLGATLREMGVPGGALPATHADSRFDEAVGERLGHGIDRLLEALHTEGDIAAPVAQLIGLGSGLTPAGDDFLAGLALAAAIPGTPVHPARSRLAAAYDDLGERTSLLSRTTMTEAVRGHARQRLLDVLHALLTPARLVDALRVAIDIGHTSGTDLVCGIYAGLSLERP